jgi:mannose/fructose-specific phosphotransferase system component IIA
MSFFTQEEYLKILLNTTSAHNALATLSHDIRNRAVCAGMNLELLAQDFDELEKVDILIALSESLACVRDIMTVLNAVNDYTQATNNQSPRTNDQKP